MIGMNQQTVLGPDPKNLLRCGFKADRLSLGDTDHHIVGKCPGWAHDCGKHVIIELGIQNFSSNQAQGNTAASEVLVRMQKIGPNPDTTAVEPVLQSLLQDTGTVFSDCTTIQYDPSLWGASSPPLDWSFVLQAGDRDFRFFKDADQFAINCGSDCPFVGATC